MGLFSWLSGRTRPSLDDGWVDLIFSETRRQLPQFGMAIVASYVARSFMSVEFRSENEEYNRRLNVAPNINQNGAEFWQKVVYKLVMDNECLVVVNATHDLLIADSFSVAEFANLDNVYSNIQVGDFMFQRSFVENEVMHFKLNTDEWANNFSQINRELDSLYDYVMKNAKAKNQLRATLGIDANGLRNNGLGNSDENSKLLTTLVTKIKKSIADNPVAIIPELNGIKYEEKSGQGGQTSGVDELAKIKKMVITDAANAIGMPNALLVGEQADLSGARDEYREGIVQSILQLFKREVSKKLQETFMVGLANDMAMLRNAERADKAVASGWTNRDDIRELFNMPPMPDGKGQEYVLTKNYEVMKGGTET